jgi:acid phosphatase (class A)
MMLQRTLFDVGLSTYRAKNHYQRIRPFMMHQGHTCTPADDEKIAKEGSYPSGHSAVGWGWALLITELVPDRADAILTRGWKYGESRIVCNAHWESDVSAGRVMAAATIARLHAVPAFNADLNAAKTEVEVARAEGAAPHADECAAETTSLK